MKSFLSALLAGIAVLTAAQGAEKPVELTANPFERPAWLSDAREVAAPAGPDKIRLDLRATLSGKPSLANVGGRIVAPGDKIEGYTLVTVSEGAAEFSDGERVIRLSVRPSQEDQADD